MQRLGKLKNEISSNQQNEKPKFQPWKVENVFATPEKPCHTIGGTPVDRLCILYKPCMTIPLPFLSLITGFSNGEPIISNLGTFYDPKRPQLGAIWRERSSPRGIERANYYHQTFLPNRTIPIIGTYESYYTISMRQMLVDNLGPEYEYQTGTIVSLFMGGEPIDIYRFQQEVINEIKTVANLPSIQTSTQHFENLLQFSASQE